MSPICQICLMAQQHLIRVLIAGRQQVLLICRIYSRVRPVLIVKFLDGMFLQSSICRDCLKEQPHLIKAYLNGAMLAAQVMLLTCQTCLKEQHLLTSEFGVLMYQALQICPECLKEQPHFYLITISIDSGIPLTLQICQICSKTQLLLTFQVNII